MKQNLLKSLHPVAIREWLKLFGCILPHSTGPYKNIDKGLLLLYQFVGGKSDRKMFISQSTFSRISTKFWSNKHLERIYRWVQSWFQRFSNPVVRCAHARCHNPEGLKHITLIVDGQDIAVILQKVRKEYIVTKRGKSGLTSFKLDFRNAARQQIMIDVRGMTVAISNSAGANSIYDGHQFSQ